MNDGTTSRQTNGLYAPFHTETVPWRSFSRGEHFALHYQDLGRFGGGSKVGVHLEELPPRKQSNPLHYHMVEEEHLYILQGSLTLTLGSDRYTMTAGDYACFPAGQPAGHTLFNHTDEPCRYLIIGENNPHDVVVYPETNRLRVRAMGEGPGHWARMDTKQG